jgi:hypothetical protein
MLPPDGPFLEPALALSALPFRPVTAGVLLPAFPPEGRRLRHARRTSYTSGRAGGLICEPLKAVENHEPPKGGYR